MGACLSAAPAHVVTDVDGDLKDYQKRYLEEGIIGQGEFGTVRFVTDLVSNVGLACKALQKGVVFKDNVLYSPLKPEVLRGEINMLRLLKGQCFCLKLLAVYESPRTLYMITEYCAGGALMEYVAVQNSTDWRTEDVSRIALQLLTAVDHCARHDVIHRDIKPENVMFQDTAPGAELRLIDFGSGVLDAPKKPDDDKDNDFHSTFAGSAFYISPEMFQRKYTNKTDVWSAGVTLYVLVAGFPADCLQKTFDLLQSSSTRNLRNLPNLPVGLPDSYFDLLEKLLEYRHRRRCSAGDLLQHEFVLFHQKQQQLQINDAKVGLTVEEIAAAAANTNIPDNALAKRSDANCNMSLHGSINRHSMILDFKRFERSLTALLATLLSKTELHKLLSLLHEQELAGIQEEERQEASIAIDETSTLLTDNFGASKNPTDETSNALLLSVQEKHEKQQSLNVILVRELRALVQREFDNGTIVETMDKLPNLNEYGSFAYHISLLKEFSPSKRNGSIDGQPSKNLSCRRSLTIFDLKAIAANNVEVESNGSVKSAGSFRSRNGSRKNAITVASLFATKNVHSVHGSNIYKNDVLFVNGNNNKTDINNANGNNEQ